MALTGQDFKNRFDRRIDRSFDQYYNNTTETEFYQRIVQIALDKKYSIAAKQKQFDELRGVLGINRTVAATSGRIILQPLAVTNFSDLSGVITTAFEQNAAVGETVTVNIVGTAGTLTGNFTVTAVSENTITIGIQPPIGTFVSGQVKTEQMVTDYMHLFSVKGGYITPSNLEIDHFAVTPSLITFSLLFRSTLRDGDKISISGVIGSTNANGIRYVKQVGTKRYQLFSDAELLIPVTGNAAYVSGGVISYITESEQMFQYKSDQFVYLDEPSVKFPRWREADNALVILPDTNLQYVVMDYMTLPRVQIDPTNNSTDLLLFYPLGMIEFIIDEGAALFDLETKDSRSYQMDVNQAITNP